MRFSILVLLFVTTFPILYAGAGGNLSVNEITIDNHEEFEEQLRKELPIGTSYADIEKYLQSLGLEHSFSKHSNTFYAIVPDIKSTLFVTTSLLIRIFVNEGNRCLKKIEFELENTGP